MHTTKALDYLLMSPDEKINFRVANNISLKDWYETTKPSSCLIPISEFSFVVSRGRWYIKEPQFYAMTKAHHKPGLDRRKKYVSLIGAAKIAMDLRRRKEMIESWPGFEELNVNSGLNLPKKIRNTRYQQMIRAGELDAVRIRMYGSDGVATGRQFKISPRSFRKVLEEERKIFRVVQEGISSGELADMRGVTKGTIGNLIRTGVKSGDLHPVIMSSYAKGRNIGLYYFNKSEAKSLASGKIVIPCSKTIQRNEMRKKILEGDGNSVDIPNISAVPWKVERELLNRIEAGNHKAFEVLLKLYDKIIDEEAEKPRFGATVEDRKTNLQRSLYLAVHQLNGAASRVGIMELTKELACDSGREDAPTWLNESRLSIDSGSFLEGVVGSRGF